MLRQLAASLLLPFERMLGNSLTQARIEATLQQGGQRLRAALAAAGDHAPEWKDDALEAVRQIEALGLLPAGEDGASAQGVLPALEAGQRERWRAAMLAQPPIRRAGVAGGTMNRLLALLEADPGGQDPEVHRLVESLLRHVELQREKALRLTPPGTLEAGWIEKHTAAILLAQAARVYRDPRCLNAAFKLVERAWRAHRHIQLDRRHVLFLLALAACESGVRELLA